MNGRTIGITVPIPGPDAAPLERVRGRYAADADEMPAHLTVLAPIDLDEDVLPAVVAHLAAVAEQTPAFSICLSGVGSFLPVSPVVFVVVETGAAECVELEARVRTGVLGVEPRFPFHPHVTVAHSADPVMQDRVRAELDGYRAVVPVTAIALHERRSGRWSTIRSFRLTDRVVAAAGD